MHMAYILQRRLRHRVIGNRFWEMLARRRVNMLKNKNISLRDFSVRFNIYIYNVYNTLDIYI
jgi:hypothetical protein